MSISQASIFICDNDDPNSVRGYRDMSEQYNKTVVHVCRMCLSQYIQRGLNGNFIAATVRQCGVIRPQ